VIDLRQQVKAMVYLYGAGNHSKVVLEACNAALISVVGIVDDNPSLSNFCGLSVKTFSQEMLRNASFIISIGNNEARKKIVNNITASYKNILHPSVLISESVSIGIGNMILHNAIVQANTTIGNHVIINTAAQIDHDCVVGDYCHIAPGAILCGNVAVGEGTFIGAGTTIIPSIKIGKWATVGAGSVVIKDVPDYALVAGNPARNIKK
jgi:sugar O-acyltransferase (sialic acid O-acetyltransferase NeuD family)